jgi:hypothetical protein
MPPNASASQIVNDFGLNLAPRPAHRVGLYRRVSGSWVAKMVASAAAAGSALWQLAAHGHSSVPLANRARETGAWTMAPIEIELATVRMLLEAITDGRLAMLLAGKDVTERERTLLTREIAAPEKTLARIAPELGENYGRISHFDQ